MELLAIEETEIQIEQEELDEDALTEAVNQCAEWFERDKEAKQPYMDEMEEMYKLWNGAHWDLTGYNGSVLRNEQQKRARPNAVENITFAMVEGLVAEFSTDMEIVDFPTEKDDDEIAQIMTDLKKFIAHKNRIRNERQKYLRWLFLYGTGIWHTYWDENWKGGKGPNRWQGDVRWTALHPAVLFPDARCKEDINEGRRCHKAVWKPIEYVQENYPDRADLVQAEMMDASDIIGEDTDSELYQTGEALQDQVKIIETWYIGEPLILGPGEESEGVGLHVIWWAGEGQRVYLDHANYVYFEPDETPKFPFIVKQCYPREGSIWGFGEPYFFKQIQIIRNKTAEIVIEGHLHQAVGQTFYSEGAVNPAQKEQIQKNGTIPGWWFPVNDIQGIRREFGAGVPTTLLAELDRLQKMAETTTGRFDISQGRTPGSVTAFRALDLLNARAQVRLRSKEEAITSSYEEAGAYINKLIDLNYTERRAYRILGNKDYNYGIFDPDKYKRVYIFSTNEVLPLEEFKTRYPTALENENEPPFEGEDFEIYSPEFDVQCKVTSILPSDRLFYMEMAKELLAAQIIDEEIFWYVMERGKFPPFEEIRDKIQQKQAERQQMMAMQMPPAQQQIPAEALQQVIAENPEVSAEEVIQIAPQEVQDWYEGLPDELKQACLQEIENAIGGGETAV